MDGAVLLLQVLPFALMAGWAPTILGTQILLLASGEGAVARTWALAIGRGIGVVLLAFVGQQLLSLLPDFQLGGPSWWQVAILVAGGIALAVAAAIQWQNRHKPHKSSKLAVRLEKTNPWWLVPIGLFGFTLQVCPLFIPGLHVITSAPASINEFWRLLAFVELILLACWLSVLPPLAVTIWGDKAKPKLKAFHVWMVDKSRPLMIFLTGVGAAFLFGYAIWETWQMTLG